MAENYSVVSRLFSDFGEASFTVLDKNGEKEQEMLIQSISNEIEGIVTLKDGEKHSLVDGDIVILQEIEETNKLNKTSFNFKQFVIKTIGKNSFSIGDTR